MQTVSEDGLLTDEKKYAAEVSDEVPVFLKTEKIDYLTSEVEKLKASVDSEIQRADEFEKKFSEALEKIESMRVRLEKTERSVLQLQEASRRVLQLQDYDWFFLAHCKIVANMYIVEIIFCKYRLL
ncbi:hypothetical protein Hanom_Chr01g00013311 [Helianthus anomalus]